MESVQNIKKRLKGVQNIGQITKAMGFVAATKMRRSQELAVASRPYTLTTLRFLGILSELKFVKLPPLLEKRPIVKTAIVLVSSDKGLVGSFNSSIFREFENFLKRDNINWFDSNSIFIAVGEKTRSYLARKKISIHQVFGRVGDFTAPEETKPIADFLITGYLENKWDRVFVFSANFITALDQKVVQRQIFPVDFEEIKQRVQEIIPPTGRFSELRQEATTQFTESVSQEYLIEPSPEAVFAALVKYLIEMRVYHLILEANASEHAARRVAMQKASDNAEELVDNFTILYNKSRQAAITQEITEISAGVEALSSNS